MTGPEYALMRSLLSSATAGLLLIGLAALGDDFSPGPATAALITPADPTPAEPGDRAAPRPVGGGHEYRRAPDGLFYVNATVNGAPVRFLIDTGANVVILTAEDADRVSADVEPGQSGGTNVETVGGRAAMRWTTLDHIMVAGREARNLPAVVAHDKLPVSILGQNMIAKFASLTIEGDRLNVR